MSEGHEDYNPIRWRRRRRRPSDLFRGIPYDYVDPVEEFSRGLESDLRRILGDKYLERGCDDERPAPIGDDTPGGRETELKSAD